MHRQVGLHTMVFLLAAMAIWPLEARSVPKVGVPDNPPLVSMSTDSQAQGFLVDLLNHIARQEGRRIEYVSLVWQEFLDRLQEGLIDLPIDIAYSISRAAIFDFHEQAVIINWGLLYTRPERILDGVADLYDMKVTVMRGGIYTEKFMEPTSQFGENIELLPEENYADVLTAVRDRKADAGIVSRMLRVQNENRYGVRESTLMLGPVDLRIATTKERNVDVLAAIDRNLRVMKKDRTSIYFRSLSRWLPGSSVAIVPCLLWLALAFLGAIVLASVLTILVMRAVIRKSARALSHSEWRYRELVENLPTVVFSADSDKKLWYISPVATELTGYSPDDLVRRSLEELVYEEDRHEFQRMLALVDEKKSAAAELRLVTKDKASRWIRASVRPIIQENAVTGLRGSFSDITNEKQMEAQFRAAQRMESVARLTAGVAHDLSNMLMVISGYSEILLTENPTENQRELIEQIKSAGDRAGSITHQLLAFSRRQVLAPEIVNLNTVVLEMETLLRRLIGEDVELVTVLDENLESTKVDPVQIEQVIMNLVVNARDAMPQGGRLTIETSNVVLDPDYAKNHISVTPGSYVLLAVSDTGVGIPREAIDHIFEPFFTTKEHGKGTGLGLSTVYGIVKQSGGYIWVYSEPSLGTTFKVYLPLHREAIPETARGEVAASVRGGSETILLAEDEDVVRDLVATILRQAGYTVIEVTNSHEARQVFTEYPDGIQVLLTDIIMPGMGGAHLAEEIKQLRPDVHVIFMSGYTDDFIAHHGMLKKGVNYLQKPFSAEVLLAKVRDVLDQHG